MQLTDGVFSSADGIQVVFHMFWNCKISIATDTVFCFLLSQYYYLFFQRYLEGDIADSLSEDDVPGPWLVILLIQFGTMIIDRALYLRKNKFGKCVFQVILVFGVHIWMFFILPEVTQRYGNIQEGTVSCFLQSSVGAQFKRKVYIQWVEWPLFYMHLFYVL